MSVTTERRWWHLRSSRSIWIVLAVLGGALLLSAAGASYAGYTYSEKYQGKILPGASVAGVDVGGMTERQARRAVKDAVGPQLDRPIEVTWRSKSWTVTPRELGAHSNAGSAVRAALEASSDASFMEKVRMRVFGDDLGYTSDVAITYPRQGARGFVQGIAKNVDRKPVDAGIDYSTGWVELTKPKVGYKVRLAKSRGALLGALEDGASEVELAVKDIEPEKTKGDYDQILLVRIGENKLYLYEDGEITNEWTVATGQPEYMTPTGLFEVTELRYMPTWVNPAPTTWGADMPASIPPGPGNPLGLRAINWSAPAIRFHGTSALYSLGYNASHGCVRMSNDDVIELYDMIDVGTPIVSTIAGELKPLYGSSSVVDTETTAATAEEDDSERSSKKGKKGN